MGGQSSKKRLESTPNNNNNLEPTGNPKDPDQPILKNVLVQLNLGKSEAAITLMQELSSKTLEKRLSVLDKTLLEVAVGLWDCDVVQYLLEKVGIGKDDRLGVQAFYQVIIIVTF